MNCPMCGELWDRVKCGSCGWQESKPEGIIQAISIPRTDSPARTKLLMKFWTAMYLAGFAKDQEWDAQEKIKVEGLRALLEEPEFPCPVCTVRDRTGEISHSVDSDGKFSHSVGCPKYKEK